MDKLRGGCGPKLMVGDAVTELESPITIGKKGTVADARYNT